MRLEQCLCRLNVAALIVLALGAARAARADVTIVHEQAPPPPVAAPVVPAGAAAPVQAAPVAGGETQTTDQHDIDDLVTQQKKLQAAMGAVSAAVPGSPQFSGADASSSAANLVFKNPTAAKFASQMSEAMRDPEFLKAADSVMKNPNNKYMYAALIVYAIVFAFIRKLAMGVTDRFLLKMLIQLMLSVTFFGGYFAIAYSVLGDPILKLCTAVATAAWKSL